MSLILDALRKLEKEKDRAGKAETDIAAAILQPDRRTGHRKILLLSSIFCLLGVVLIVAGAAVTYLVAANGTPLKTIATDKQKPPNCATNQQNLVVGKAQAEPPLEMPPRAPEATPKSVNVNQVKTALLPVRIARPSPEEPGIRETVTEMEKHKPVDLPRSESSAVSPKLKISGIIWLDQRAERRVLINGGSFKEGDMIEDVRVELIEPTRIRFTKHGKYFEIPITQN